MADLVVARYRAGTKWTETFPCNIIVYNKHSGANLLPNRGREAHTYLTHILRHYDGLAGITIFAQDDVRNHVSDADLARMRMVTDESIAFEQFGKWTGETDMAEYTDYIKYLFLSHQVHVDPSRHRHKIYREPSDTLCRTYVLQECDLSYDARLASLPVYPRHIHCTFGSIFAVSSSVIRRRSPAWYEKALKLVDWDEHPAGAHFLERVWPFVFFQSSEPFRCAHPLL